jgi:hypothetical protein
MFASNKRSPRFMAVVEEDPSVGALEEEDEHERPEVSSSGTEVG